MKIIKGFASHVKFTSNAKDIVHPIGELSIYSQTYAKDRGIYGILDKEDIRLHTFNTSSDGQYIELDTDWSDHVFKVINSIYAKILEGGTSWTDQIEDYLITEHQEEASEFKVGNIIKEGAFSAPSWVSWKRNGHESYIRIWFSDSVFRSSFDEYEIIIIPPLEVVDDFFRNKKEVKNLLEVQNEPVAMAARGQIAKDFKPNTIFLSLVYDWHDRVDPNFTIPTRWDILIYGEHGNNIDAIKDAIIDHVLKKSVHDIEEWKKIFPEIFRRTEFVIIPRWDLYAIPNRTIVEGIYSPVVKHKDVLDIVKEYAQTRYGYTEQHITDYTTIVAHQYRSLQTLVVSHPENRGNKYLLTDEYPDYIAENTLSQDFNRMQAKTRLWSEGLTELIIHAESFDEYSATPPGMTRLIRNGKLYIVKSFNYINYLVAAKINFYRK